MDVVSTEGNPTDYRRVPGLFRGEWLTLAQAAERFGCDRGALQEACLRGTLPARKPFPHRTAPWLVRPRDVEAYLRRVGPNGIRLGRPPLRPPRLN